MFRDLIKILIEYEKKLIGNKNYKLKVILKLKRIFNNAPEFSRNTKYVFVIGSLGRFHNLAKNVENEVNRKLKLKK